MEFLHFENLENRLQSDDLAITGKPVRARYRLTKGDFETLNNLTYAGLSLKQCCDDAHTQELLRAGQLVGFLEHPPDVYDSQGRAVDCRYDTNPLLFVFDTLEYDDQANDVKTWVHYIHNELGIYYSDQIRQGFKPKISMRSLLACDTEGNCRVKQIRGGDQVRNPAVPDAELLEWRELDQPITTINSDSTNNQQSLSIPTIQPIQLDQSTNSQLLTQNDSTNCGCGCNGQGDCNTPAGVSRTAKQNSKFYISSGDANKMRVKIQDRVLEHNKDTMSLDQIYGQSLQGWLTPEAISSLAVWAAMAEMAEGATTGDAEMMTDCIGVKQTIKIIKHNLDTITTPRSAQSLLHNNQVPVVPVNTVNPAPNSDSLAALQSQVGQALAVMNTLIADSQNRKATEEKLAKDQADRQAVATQINKIFSDSVIAFPALNGKEAVNYQRVNFSDNEIKTAKDEALKASTPQDAISIARVSMDAFSSVKAAQFLGNQGFNGNTQPRGNTAGIEVTRNHVPGRERLDKLRAAYDSHCRQHDWDNYVNKRDHKGVIAEKVKDIKKGSITQKVDHLLIEADRRMQNTLGKDSVNFYSELSDDKFFAMFPTEAQKDSQSLTTAAQTVVLPTFAALILEESFEDLWILDLFRGIGNDSLVPQIAGSPAIGRVFNFGIETVLDGTYSDPDHNLPTTADTVFDEISLETTRQEFVTRDYGLAVRFGRGDMMALLNSNPSYDQVARLVFRAKQRLDRRIDKRGCDELFYGTSEINPTYVASESPANVAPAGTGPKNYTGEYTYNGSNGVTIGGRTYGNTSSNIVAAVRCLGLANGNVTNTAFPNIAIVKPRPRPTIDQYGAITTTTDFPIRVMVNSVDITSAEGLLSGSGTSARIVQKQGGTATPKWALDPEGFFLFTSDASVVADPQGAGHAINLRYYEDTNYVWFNQDNDIVAPEDFYNRYFQLTAGVAASLRGTPQFATAKAVLMPEMLGSTVKSARIFDKFRSPNGTDLPSIYSPDRFVGSYGDLSYLKKNGNLPFGDGRSLVMAPGYCGYALSWMEVSEMYRGQKADTSTGAIQTLPQGIIDIMLSDVFGFPKLKHKTGGTVSNCPFKALRHYGTLRTAVGD